MTLKFVEFHCIIVLYNYSLAVYLFISIIYSYYLALYPISSCYHISFSIMMANANCINEDHARDSNNMCWLKVINIYHVLS